MTSKGRKTPFNEKSSLITTFVIVVVLGLMAFAIFSTTSSNNMRGQGRFSRSGVMSPPSAPGGAAVDPSVGGSL